MCGSRQLLHSLCPFILMEGTMETPKNDPQNPFDDDNNLIVDGPEKQDEEELKG
jgi:hypothetical protein